MILLAGLLFLWQVKYAQCISTGDMLKFRQKDFHTICRTEDHPRDQFLTMTSLSSSFTLSLNVHFALLCGAPKTRIFRSGFMTTRSETATNSDQTASTIIYEPFQPKCNGSVRRSLEWKAEAAVCVHFPCALCGIHVDWTIANAGRLVEKMRSIGRGARTVGITKSSNLRWRNGTSVQLISMCEPELHWTLLEKAEVNLGQHLRAVESEQLDMLWS